MGSREGGNGSLIPAVDYFLVLDRVDGMRTRSLSSEAVFAVCVSRTLGGHQKHREFNVLKKPLKQAHNLGYLEFLATEETKKKYGRLHLVGKYPEKHNAETLRKYTRNIDNFDFLRL